MAIENDKLYLSVSELAEHLNETQATLRFWEEQFDILRPGITATGRRRYSKSDVKNAELIQFLLREQGYTIEGAKKHIQRNKGKNLDEKEVRERLIEIRRQLYAIRSELNDMKE